MLRELLIAAVVSTSTDPASLEQVTGTALDIRIGWEKCVEDLYLSEKGRITAEETLRDRPVITVTKVVQQNTDVQWIISGATLAVAIVATVWALTKGERDWRPP